MENQNKVQAISMKRGRLSSTKQQERQNKHFCVVLNIEVPDNPVDVEETNQIREINCEEPSFLAIRNAISKTKKGKSPGIDNITAELFKAGVKSSSNKIKELSSNIWNNKQIPSNWKKDPMIKLPKKGNQKECKN